MPLVRAAVVAALLVLSAPPAHAQPRIVGLTCEIGGGRTRVLVPRVQEEASDDELICRAQLTGVARGWTELAGELRLRQAGGGVRVVATGMFETDGDGRAHIEGLVVAHSTWAGAISWQDPRRPRLRLELRAYRQRPGAPRRAWAVVASARLELGRRRR